MSILDRASDWSRSLRLALVAGALLVASLAAELWGPDPARAALVLLLAVLVAALLGPGTGLVGALGAAAILNVVFTRPRWHLQLHSTDDNLALVVFVAVAALTGTLVSNAATQRRRAQRREREAVLMLDLIAQLRGGAALGAVAGEASSALRDLFDFERVDIAFADMPRPVPGQLHIEAPAVMLDADPSSRHALTSEDDAALTSMTTALSAVVEQLEAERTAETARVAAQVAQSRAGLLSAVSHNLRTPLAAIRAATSALLDPHARLTTSDRDDLASTARNEAARLEALVAKLLDLGRIRAGGLEIVPEPIDVEGLVQAVVHRLRPLVAHVDVTIAVEEVGTVEADPTATEQILVNLLENALRYAPKSAIEISATRREPVLELAVIDHGPGIDPSERVRVFDEFYRVDRRHEAEGTGLGLAIVKALVLAQRGSVRVEETPGGGATFVVRLPVTASGGGA